MHPSSVDLVEYRHEWNTYIQVQLPSLSHPRVQLDDQLVRMQLSPFEATTSWEDCVTCSCPRKVDQEPSIRALYHGNIGSNSLDQFSRTPPALHSPLAFPVIPHIRDLCKG